MVGHRKGAPPEDKALTTPKVIEIGHSTARHWSRTRFAKIFDIFLYMVFIMELREYIIYTYLITLYNYCNAVCTETYNIKRI